MRKFRFGRLSYVMAPRPARLPDLKPTNINPKDARYDQRTTGGRSQTVMGIARGMVLANAIGGMFAGPDQGLDVVPDEEPDLADYGLADDGDWQICG